MRSFTASILAVGTEVSDGQIANINAAWLAKNLTEMGFHVALHLAVPDERGKIRSALEICRNHSHYIFVTGGLGPTRDDFTREVIAEWAETPLEFCEPAFSEVSEKLTVRGVPVRDGHRRQCYFPKSARLWPNQVGTAHGFSLNSKGIELVALPGPPAEIASIWSLGLQEYLKDIVPTELRLKLWKWSTLGLGESEVALKVEEVLAETDGLEIGYRLHPPYVETKVWAQASRELELQPVFQKMETALAEFLVLRQSEDIAEQFVSLLSKSKIDTIIIDGLSRGLISRRLEPFVDQFSIPVDVRSVFRTDDMALSLEWERLKSLNLNVFMLFPIQESGKWELRTSLAGKVVIAEQSPAVRDNFKSERGRRMAVERSLIYFRDLLRA